MKLHLALLPTGGDTWGSVSSNGWFKSIGVAWSLAMSRNDVATLDAVTTKLVNIVGAALDDSQ